MKYASFHSLLVFESYTLTKTPYSLLLKYPWKMVNAQIGNNVSLFHAQNQMAWKCFVLFKKDIALEKNCPFFEQFFFLSLLVFDKLQLFFLIFSIFFYWKKPGKKAFWMPILHGSSFRALFIASVCMCMFS